MAKKDNLVLIGMPASGKSTVGVILAKVIGFDFIDTDLLIQRREGMRLSRIIEEKGIDGFIAIENEVNASVQASRCVIATGGSAVYGEEAMRHLRDIGAVIWRGRPSVIYMRRDPSCMKSMRISLCGREAARSKKSSPGSSARCGREPAERNIEFCRVDLITVPWALFANNFRKLRKKRPAGFLK